MASGLRHFGLSGNWEIGACPSVLAHMPHLTHLDLGGCGLAELPAWLAHATDLRVLQLGSNDLQQVRPAGASSPLLCWTRAVSPPAPAPAPAWP